MTIAELRTQFKNGTLKPSDAVATSLATIKEKDTDIKAFLDVYEDAKETATVADAAYADGKADEKPLLGVPIAIKNNILIKDKKATAASKILENYTAIYDATIITRLREAGAVFVGATNLDEFAMGSSTENSAFGATKNPLDTTRVPGGSSGGSAAAVAMNAVPAAIGTDTGGSIRQPASYCGLVGFKPTYGAVSRYGLIAMGSSLDQAGPLTHTVADAKLLHDVMAGPDKMDMTTISDTTYKTVPTKDTYTFGVPRSFLTEGINPDVAEVFESYLKTLTDAGHTVVDVDVPMFEQGLSAYYIVMPAEVSSNLARFDGMRYGLSVDGDTLLDVYEKTRAEGFGEEVKRRILLGTYVLSSGYYDAYYAKAEYVRHLMREELKTLFMSVDAIITPTTPSPAFTAGSKSDPLSMYKEDIFTVPVNLTGVPALSVPALSVERDGNTLPVGVQFIGPHAGDEQLFDIGMKVYDTTR